MNSALQVLALRPRNILRYRYGLHKEVESPLTLTEVGDLYGLKGERVRQIESLAKAVLRSGLEREAASLDMADSEDAPI